MAQICGPALLFDALTAIGTIGATVAAVWIALADRTRRRQENLDHARLGAAAMGLRAMRLRESVRLAVRWFEFVREHDGAPGAFASRAINLREAITIDSDELPPLIPLPNSCALNLAAALDKLDMGCKMLEHFSSQVGREQEVARKAFAEECLPIFEDIHDLLKLACIELEKVTPIK